MTNSEFERQLKEYDAFAWRQRQKPRKRFIPLKLWETTRKAGLVDKEPTMLHGVNYYPNRPIPEEADHAEDVSEL